VRLPSLPTSMSRRIIAAAAGTLAAAIAMTGCSSSGQTASSSSGSAGTATFGGTLTMDIPADEGCVDPQQNLGRTQLVIGRALADSLVWEDPSTGKFVPWLASSWTESPDGKAYTFTLRKNVTFSDGSALNAQTVKDNLDAIVALGAHAPVASSYLTTYTGATVVSPMTVRVSFSAPDPSFLQALSTPSMGILSDASTKRSQSKLCQGDFAGSGPFTLASYIQNASQTLTRRPGYNWAPAGLHGGGAYVDAVDVSVVPESSTRAGAVVSGQSDIEMEVQKADLPTLDAGEISIAAKPNPGLPQQLYVNPGRGPLTDPVVRQALEIAINRPLLVSATLNKYEKVATSALASTTPGYTDLKSYLAFDPAKAAQMLQQDGWVAGPGGIRVKNGQKLSLTLLYGTELYGFAVPLMELIQSEYKSIGVELTLDPQPLATANADWAQRNYELQLSGLTRGDPDVLRTAYYGESPALDKLLTQEATTVSTTQRMKVVAEAEKYILQQAFAIPINENTLPVAYASNVKNVTFTADSLLLLYNVSLAQ